LEDDQLCNAGFGSNLTEDGTVECDAAVMDGDCRSYGACGAVPGVRNPVRLAARLLERQRSGVRRALGRVHPMLLVGDGARRWAEAEGLDVVTPAALVSEDARARYARYLTWLREEESEPVQAESGVAQVALGTAEGTGGDESVLGALDEVGASLGSIHEASSTSLPRKRPRSPNGTADHVSAATHDSAASSVLHDTVGAVVCDGVHVSAAVSSGGVWLKHCGRVGEAASFGAGCWAEDAQTSTEIGCSWGVGASVSGVGEQVMSRLLAQAACRALQPDDVCVEEAATRVLASSARCHGGGSEHDTVAPMDGPFAGFVALRCQPRRAPAEGEDGGAAHGLAPRVELVVAHTTPSFAIGYLTHAISTPKALVSRHASASVSTPARVLCRGLA
jgi:taspase (threonine aspartase 1)